MIVRLIEVVTFQLANQYANYSPTINFIGFHFFIQSFGLYLISILRFFRHQIQYLV